MSTDEETLRKNKLWLDYRLRSIAQDKPKLPQLEPDERVQPKEPQRKPKPEWLPHTEPPPRNDDERRRGGLQYHPIAMVDDYTDSGISPLDLNSFEALHEALHEDIYSTIGEQSDTPVTSWSVFQEYTQSIFRDLVKIKDKDWRGWNRLTHHGNRKRSPQMHLQEILTCA